jgi:hypothetical protein
MIKLDLPFPEFPHTNQMPLISGLPKASSQSPVKENSFFFIRKISDGEYARAIYLPFK